MFQELESLNLPIHVKRGVIQKLSVSFPWSRILSDSVHVRVENLEVIITQIKYEKI
jgi:hypothetical protein